jgi:hypothetical protein
VRDTRFADLERLPESAIAAGIGPRADHAAPQTSATRPEASQSGTPAYADWTEGAISAMLWSAPGA